MVKQATALAATDLEPIDRLEEKVKLLVSVISQLREERAEALDHNAKLTNEVGALRARLADAEHTSTEIIALRDERASIRTRVADMLQQLEGHLSRVVTVEIAGQRYPIRSSLDERYVAELSAYVEQKMRAAADAAPASDTLGLALLVALNIADEYFRAREQRVSASGDFTERTLRLERIVDEALSTVTARAG